MDAHQELASEQASVAFVDAVEAVRMGTLYAHDVHLYGRWRADTLRHSGRQPGGATTIEQLARDYPDHVGKPN